MAKIRTYWTGTQCYGTGYEMMARIRELEAENKALRKAAAAIKEHTDTARKKMRMVYAAPVWSAIISHLDVEHDRILAILAETEGRSE